MKRIRKIAITVLALMISASSVFAFVQNLNLQPAAYSLQPGNDSSHTDQYAYMPYGVATHAGNSQTPYQWLGGYGVYYDHTTELHLTTHRAYSSDMRKFISPDPLGIDGGVNVYAYANLNPLFFVDPLGLCADGAWETGSYWGDVAQVYRGYGDMFANMGKGIAQTVTHPIQTARGLGSAVMHPGATWNAIKSDYAARAGTLRGQGSIVMEGLFTVGTIGAGAIANDTGKIGQLLRSTRAGRNASRLRIVRAHYVEEVNLLDEIGLNARAAGQSTEATARMLHAERNALKLKYRNLTPSDQVRIFELRNIEKYGNSLGPSIEQLRLQGKTWEDIINSASRTGGADLGL